MAETKEEANGVASESPVNGQRKNYILSEPFVFLYTLTHGIYFTTLPQVLLSKRCKEKFNETICDAINDKKYKSEQAGIFADVAVWNMGIIIATAIVSLICILPFGSLSDIVSKKKLMLFPTILRGLQCVLFIIDIQLNIPSIALLVTGAGITGLYGDINGALTLGASYLADCTSAGPERTVRMIGVGACSYAGSGVGAYLSGLVAERYGFTYSFILGFSICILNAFIVVFVLPGDKGQQAKEFLNESGQQKHGREQLSYAIRATKHTFVSIFKFARRYCTSRKGYSMWLLITAYFFSIVCLNGEATIFALYLKHSPFTFSPFLIGVYMLLLMAVRGVGGFILFLVIYRFSLADSYVTILGLFSFIGTYLTMALSTTRTQLFAFSLLSLGYPLPLSGIRSCLTKKVDVSEHGTVLSYACFVALIGVLLTTFSINALFKYTVEIFTGTCMLFLAGSSVLALIMFLIACGVDRFSNAANESYQQLSDAKETDEMAEMKRAAKICDEKKTYSTFKRL